MTTGNPKLSTLDLARAAFALDLKSRLAAANHPDTPAAARAHLADDPHRIVRLAVALNDRASGYNLARIVDRESDWLPRLRWLLSPNGIQASVFSVVAGHPNADETTLSDIVCLAPGSAAAGVASSRLELSWSRTGS